MGLAASFLSFERKILSFYGHWRHVGFNYAVKAWRRPMHEEFASLFKHLKKTSLEPIILDVGANEGNFTRAVLSWRAGATLHCIEPIPENVELLKIESAKNENVIVHALALSDRSGVMLLHKTQSTAGSSFQRPTDFMKEAFPEFAPDASIDVKTLTLAEFFRQNEIELCDLLKLDVQGHELQILNTLPECRSKIKAILMEVSFEHLYEGDASIQTAVSELKKQGFYLKDFTHFVRHPKQGYLLQGDALFLNLQFQR